MAALIPPDAQKTAQNPQAWNSISIQTRTSTTSLRAFSMDVVALGWMAWPSSWTKSNSTCILSRPRRKLLQPLSERGYFLTVAAPYPLTRKNCPESQAWNSISTPNGRQRHRSMRSRWMSLHWVGWLGRSLGRSRTPPAYCRGPGGNRCSHCLKEATFGQGPHSYPLTRKKLPRIASVEFDQSILHGRHLSGRSRWMSLHWVGKRETLLQRFAL